MGVANDLAPDDVLIDRAAGVNSKQRLEFVLTAHGLAQLSKTVSGGRIVNDTVIDRLKENLVPETFKGAAFSGVFSLLGMS